MKDYEQRATAIIMNTIEGVKAQIRKAYDKGYKDGQKEKPQAIYEMKVEEYNKGLNEAWECARKIAQTMKRDEITTCFGERDEIGRKMIFEEYSASEAIAKIKEYEDIPECFRGQDAEIKVGDEVYSDAFDDKGIVTHITEDGNCIAIICSGSSMMKVGPVSLHKTGRHFDAIPEVLKQMNREEDK